MKKAVVYGSGKIGRGFIGKIFAESGYQVCFLDRIQALVDGLNAAVFNNSPAGFFQKAFISAKFFQKGSKWIKAAL